MDAHKGLPQQRPVVCTEPGATGGHLSHPERRRITVLSCQVVSATTVGGQEGFVPPSRGRCAYQDTCAEVVRHFQGHLARHLDDGVQAYFGYPQTYEDNACRAVYAGLDILRALQGQGLTLGLSVHTAWALIGEARSHTPRPQIILDRALELALRLGRRVHPNAVIICPTTYHLTHGLFTCKVLEPQLLNRLPAPPTMYRVLAEAAPRNPFRMGMPPGQTPLVGRHQEIETLQTCWARAKTSAGQVVLLSGEAGIGKSCLVQALRRHLTDEPLIRLEHSCSPYHQHSALHPVIEIWQHLFRFRPHSRVEERLLKLETVLRSYRFALDDSVPLLASLLSLPLPPDRYPPLLLTPQRAKQKTLALLLAVLREVTKQQPVLFILEDLHWADPSTLEFIRNLMQQAPAMRLLAIFTTRPAFKMLQDVPGHTTLLSLGRLSRPHVAQLLLQLTGGKPLPEEIHHQLLSKTDGIPLFVEELTKMLLESDILQEHPSHYALTRSALPLSIPTTLQDSLMARLDHLGPVKGLAQVGAILGRSFSYQLMQAVTLMDEARLQQQLQRLVDAELLFQQGLPPHSTYVFKHALIQEAAYQSLLKRTRQESHARIAQVLEERFPDLVESQPELVAHHYTEAKRTAQAIAYWRRAGGRASMRSACAEAVVHLHRGLALLQALPDTADGLQQELDIQTILGPTLMALKSPVDPEVEQTYARARALCHQVGTSPKLVWALEGLWAFYLVRGQLDTAQELGEQLLGLAERLQTPMAFAVAHQALGLTFFYWGAFSTALHYLEEGIAHYALQPSRSRVVRGVHDPGVMCHAFVALASCLRGDADQALLRLETMLQLARELIHPYSLTFAYCACAVLHQCRQNVSDTEEWGRAAVALATEQGFPLWSAMGMILQGWALTLQGQADNGLAQLRKGLTIWQAMGAKNVLPYFLALLAEAYGQTGQIQAGLKALGEARVLIDATGERWWEAEIYRLQGTLLLRQAIPDEQGATMCFRQAFRMARHQESTLWQRRAAASWSRLLRKQGKRAEARQLLRHLSVGLTDQDEPDATLPAIQSGLSPTPGDEPV